MLDSPLYVFALYIYLKLFKIFGQFHPSFYANIAGWGSTIEAGAKPYRHVPVQIVRPGNVASVSGNLIFAL